jgi:hypothetical protein
LIPANAAAVFARSICAAAATYLGVTCGSKLPEAMEPLRELFTKEWS